MSSTNMTTGTNHMITVDCSSFAADCPAMTMSGSQVFLSHAGSGLPTSSMATGSLVSPSAATGIAPDAGRDVAL